MNQQLASFGVELGVPKLQAKLELKFLNGQRKRLAYQGISHLQLALSID